MSALERIVAIMLKRAECDLAASDERLDERDVKLATAIAALVGKVRDLQTNAGKQRGQGEDNDAAAASDERLEQSVLDALDALVDGRAAGLARPVDG